MGTETDNSDVVMITAEHIASLTMKTEEQEAVTTESLGDQVIKDLKGLPTPTRRVGGGSRRRSEKKDLGDVA